jgi:hypothetical protein
VGILDWLVPKGELETFTMENARRIAENSPPAARTRRRSP